MMRHPRAVATFSDSGAHVSQLMDSSLQTHLLYHWVGASRRSRSSTRSACSRSCQRAVGVPQSRARSRGVAADLVVFDLPTIGAGMPEVVRRSAPRGGPSCSARAASSHGRQRRGPAARRQAHGRAAGSASPGASRADIWSATRRLSDADRRRPDSRATRMSRSRPPRCPATRSRPTPVATSSGTFGACTTRLVRGACSGEQTGHGFLARGAGP